MTTDDRNNRIIDLVERYAEICDAKREIDEAKDRLRKEILEEALFPVLKGATHLVKITQHEFRTLDRAEIEKDYERFRKPLPLKVTYQTRVVPEPIRQPVSASKIASILDEEYSKRIGKKILG